MKKLLLILSVLISLRSFAQTDTVKKQSAPPLINSITTMTPEQVNNTIGSDLNSYSNEARIGLLMEGGGVVLGFGVALLSINSVSATPINVSLISGAVISFIGFCVHYDSYRYLKHSAHLLKHRKN